ncbi:MAG: sigma-70 family RNA polymerase sigma factor, partial [Opitutaceae bacterium]
MTDDAELLRRYAEERDEGAFAEIVRRHVDLAYAVAWRKVGGDAHLAEDVVQQVFADLARKAATLTRHRVLAGWLFTSVHFAATQTVRAERRRREREQKAEAMNELLHDSASPIEWERLRPLLDDLVLELNERYREAVLLRYFEERAFGEVAAKLNLSEDGARSRVDRAVDKLQALLARRGITSTGAALGLVLANQASAAPAGLAASVTTVVFSGTAGSGSAMLGFLNFMSTTKFVAVTATVIALVAIGTSMHEAGVIREMEASVAAVRAERDALRARVAVGLKEPAGQRSVAPPASPGAGSQQPPPPLQSTRGDFDYVLDNPEARSAYLKRATLTLKTRFDQFFRTAGLTGAQQDRFLKLAMDDAEGRLDALAMRRAAGGLDRDGAPMDRAAIERIGAFQKQRDEEVANGMRELLGEKFKPAMENLATMHERNVADKLASQLYYTDSPLTA